MKFNTPGTSYWASLVGERNADSWVPCLSPHLENRWSPGMIRVENGLSIAGELGITVIVRDAKSWDQFS